MTSNRSKRGDPGNQFTPVRDLFGSLPERWDERDAMDRISRAVRAESDQCPQDARVRMGGFLRQLAFYFDGKKE